MDLSGIFTVGNAAIAIGVLIALAAGVLIYTVVMAPKKAQKTALLYSEWAHQLQLPTLGKNAALNSKAIERFFKLIWPKKYPEELDVRQEIEGLTQRLALDFTEAANTELQPKDSPYAFIYDVDDAASGYLRLYSVEKASTEYRLFRIHQALLSLIKDVYPVNEFSHVDLADNVDPENPATLESFILTGSEFPTDDDAVATHVLQKLAENFEGVWLASVVAEDAIIFRRESEADLAAALETPEEANPFEAKLEAKRQADREREEREAEETKLRETAWREAEAERKTRETAAREAAIAAGEVSRYVNEPLPFLAAEVEIAADEAGLFTLDDEPEVMKSDGIGAPILFCVYSDEVLKSSNPKVQRFSELLLASLHKNLGGEWAVEVADSSLTFRREL